MASDSDQLQPGPTIWPPKRQVNRVGTKKAAMSAPPSVLAHILLIVQFGPDWSAGCDNLCKEQGSELACLVLCTSLQVLTGNQRSGKV